MLDPLMQARCAGEGGSPPIREGLRVRKLALVYPHRQSHKVTLVMPPIGLEFVATAVEDLVEQVTIVDVRFDSPDVVREKLDGADLIGVSIMWANRRERTFELIRSLPAHVPTCVGGAYASVVPETVLERCPNVDFLVLGEGEEALREVVQGRPIQEIAGICYRDGDRVVQTPARPPPRFSAVRYPNRGLRDPRHQHGFHIPGANVTLPMDLVQTSRGCPFNCRFCADFISMRRWEARDAESVVAELRAVEAPYVMISDDFFTFDVRRTEEICDAIIREGISKAILCQTRISITKHPRVLRKMERAGVVLVLFGIESAQERTLKAIGKGFSLRDVKAAFRVMKRTGIVANANFIIGHIGESRREMLQIADMAQRFQIDTILLSRLRSDEGSRLDEVLEGHPDYYVAPDRKVYSARYGKRELKQIFHAVNWRFYLSFYMLRKLPKILRPRLRPAAWFLLWAGLAALWDGLFASRRQKHQVIEGARIPG